MWIVFQETKCVDFYFGGGNLKTFKNFELKSFHLNNSCFRHET